MRKLIVLLALTMGCTVAAPKVEPPSVNIRVLTQENCEKTAPNMVCCYSRVEMISLMTCVALPEPKKGIGI